MRAFAGAMALCALVGCATLARDSFDERFGAAEPTRYDRPAAPAPGGVAWRADVQPILQRRCVVCHGCYDAPCQLKLGAWQGVARGGSSDNVYDTERIREAAPSRLFVDAKRPSQWRAKGFFPVLNDRSPTTEAQLAGSLLYQTLVLKQQHPLPAGPVLGEGFDFGLDRAQACPRIEQFEAHAQKSPLTGMPYGLPGLEAREMDTIARWLRSGAPYEGDLPLSALQGQQVQAWEAFLNGPSTKERLMSRYLFEHLFLGHLVFDADATHRAFRLVRSSTPPGRPLQVIGSRRPYDDPGVERFWYRLEPERELIPHTMAARRPGPRRRGTSCGTCPCAPGSAHRACASWPG